MENKDKNDNENVISEEDDLPSYKSDSIKEPSNDFNDEIIYPPPETFHDFDKEEEEIKYSKKNDNEKNNDGKNNENIDISKKDSKDNNLNIDSMINSSQSTAIKDKFNDFSFNNNPTQVSYESSNIDNSNATNNSGISNSREKIKKDESIKEDIKVDINEDLLSSLKKAFPGLPSTNKYKEIYKYLKDNNYFKLTIFEVMNIIQREVGIKLTENKCKNKEHNDYAYNFPIEFLDIVDPAYINKEHLFIMKTYKTMCTKDKYKYYEIKELTQDFLYDKDKNDRRRKVIKFLDGTYNYIPKRCKNEKCDKNCIYSHNENEINYHPLFYKTEFIDNTDYSESNMALCPTAKNYEEDFRIIYNYKDQNIINLMNLLDQECSTKKRIKEFYKIKNIKNFNLNTFKIRKCKKHEKKECDKDQHLCYFYHNLSERRRPPYLYRYTNERCEDFKLKEDKIIKNCKNGEFCYKTHTSNEYNYHNLHFGKLLICCRNIKDGKCEFIDTCYAYHDENDENTKIKIIKEKLEKKRDKLKKEKNIDKFKCQKCDRIATSFTFYYLKCKAKHILCKNCYNKIKTNKICPLCHEEFTGEKKIIFKSKDSSIKKEDSH